MTPFQLLQLIIIPTILALNVLTENLNLDKTNVPANLAMVRNIYISDLQIHKLLASELLFHKLLMPKISLAVNLLATSFDTGNFDQYQLLLGYRRKSR